MTAGVWHIWGVNPLPLSSRQQEREHATRQRWSGWNPVLTFYRRRVGIVAKTVGPCGGRYEIWAPTKRIATLTFRRELARWTRERKVSSPVTKVKL